MHRVTLGKEEEPTDDKKYVKWINRNDEACGLIRMPISHDLSFHLQGIDAPNKSWENHEAMFGKHNIIQYHQLENQLINLIANYFPCIEDYFSKLKTH
jgi:hypothetical protein